MDPEVKKSVPYLQQICDRADHCPQKQSILSAEALKREAEFVPGKYRAYCRKHNTARVYVLEPSSSYLTF